MPRKTARPDPNAARVRELETRLFFARVAIIALVPEAQQKALAAASWCRTAREIAQWEAWAIERVMTVAGLNPRRHANVDGAVVRANCPLCGRGVWSGPARGYAVPTGLQRHLKGSRNFPRCAVFAAAIEPCYEQIADGTKAQAGRGSSGAWKRGPCPWAVALPDHTAQDRPSARIINFRRE